MEIITYIFLFFGVVAAIDRIVGNKLGLGSEFEKGLMMLGPLTLSMAGMIILVPFISEALSGIAAIFPALLDFSIVPASFIANDMGGAHLAVALSENTEIGLFNGLIVSSMMGCTVSFIIPFALQATEKRLHNDILFGILFGIITIPVGLIASGVMLSVPVFSLLINLVPLILFSALIAFGLLKFPRATVKIFSVFAFIIKLLITLGLVLGIADFLLGERLLASDNNLISAAKIIINIAAIMTGAFPLLSILKRFLKKPIERLGGKLSVNESSAFGFIATLGNSITTFEMADKMDKKGLILNSAFAVSASFLFVDHLAFTISFNSAYLPALICGKFISGLSAVLLALLYNKKKNGGLI